MKILVCVKRVTDYEAKLKVASNGLDVERTSVNMIMNPFDEIAVEEALRIKEKHGSEVIALSIGTNDSETQLRSALAMGADRAILVLAEENIGFSLESQFIAKIIKTVVDKERPDIILMGKQAIDDDNHQVSEMLSEMCDMPQATQANTIKIEGKTATVVREADGGLETINIDLPGIITADLRLNEPRYASLPGIMKAKKKPLDIFPLASLNIAFTPMVKVKKLLHPNQRKQGIRVNDVSELVKRLKEEAKVL